MKILLNVKPVVEHYNLIGQKEKANRNCSQNSACQKLNSEGGSGNLLQFGCPDLLLDFRGLLKGRFPHLLICSPDYKNHHALLSILI